ncbi:MAG: DNA polymerase I [Ruminococcus sp.]|nr:DNA polymerase I [Ruminococcus sp.]
MKILAIDGNSIMNRAFYGIKALATSKGEYTNAITGFMNIYLREIGVVKPDCVAVAFDRREPTFRHKADSSYKANRKGMPDELAQQMPLIKEILGDMGVRTVECAGYEADDILGTLSNIFSGEDECVILTGDRDSLQLLSDSCTVRLATNRETLEYSVQSFEEEYGLEPKQLIDLKGLMGDASDNISGVRGIGKKTASALIAEQGSVENLYENLDSMTLTRSVRDKLESGREDAFNSKYLATIVLEAPIDRDKEGYLIGEVKADKLRELLSRLEMSRLMKRLELVGENAHKDEAVEAKDLAPLEVAKLESADLITDKSVFTLEGGALSVECKGRVYFTTDEEVIRAYFESDYEKRCFCSKDAYRWCFERGVQLKGLTFSCDLAGYLLNSLSSEYTVEGLCLDYKVSYRSDMKEYADVSTLAALSDRLKQELEANEMIKLFNEIELPLSEVLASMEFYGVKADADGIRAFGEKLKTQLDGLTEEIYALAGCEFNISSPKQLGKVLFEDLNLPNKRKTKSGYSTNAQVLEAIADKHPIVPKVLEYRTLSKLNSTYVDGLLKQIHADGRVHSVFKQTETRTGRISSTEPNMQNIPVRKPIGREMRRFFTAQEGCLLIDADYSQIELRVLASVCGDENMRQAFLSGKDIHTSTAAQVFDLPEEFVSEEMRHAAKAVNFGIIYGIGAYSLSEDIGVSYAEAKRYIQSYLDNFPNVTKFMNETVDFGIKNGYVTTIFSRRRYIPEFKSSSKQVQAFGKRAAMNAPIQGAAADIIKLAMVKVYNALKEELPQAKLILQVHDELILEVPKRFAQQAAQLLKREMESVMEGASALYGVKEFSVPLTADVHCGESWFEAKQ